jgi:hypothetical protein
MCLGCTKIYINNLDNNNGGYKNNGKNRNNGENMNKGGNKNYEENKKNGAIKVTRRIGIMGTRKIIRKIEIRWK